jgi:hypothetical protein
MQFSPFKFTKITPLGIWPISYLTFRIISTLMRKSKFLILCLKVLSLIILTPSLLFYDYQKAEWAVPGYLLTKMLFLPEIKPLSLLPFSHPS